MEPETRCQKPVSSSVTRTTEDSGTDSSPVSSRITRSSPSSEVAMTPAYCRPPARCTSNVYWLSIEAIALHSMLIVPMSSV